MTSPALTRILVVDRTAERAAATRDAIAELVRHEDDVHGRDTRPLS